MASAARQILINNPVVGHAPIRIVTKENLARERKEWGFKPGFDIKEKLRIVQSTKGGTVVEFIGTDDFASAWYERQRYEVDAGKDEEPILYRSIYREVKNSALPRNVTIHALGPGAVVFEEVKEGGEVQFVTIGESQRSVPILHYSAGLEYNKDLIMYNELWNVSIIERQAGIAYNALRNHLHLYPILSAAYTPSNQTPASAVGNSLPEKYLRTIEDAITASIQDTTNPRRGPYVLLVSTSDLFLLERALTRVSQEGFTLQSSAISRIREVIAYDGWTGWRGMKSTTYPGVASGKAYLIDISGRDRYFGSFIKQDLERTAGESDMSRFILEQVIWDAYLGVYASPLSAVEEITWPSS